MGFFAKLRPQWDRTCERTGARKKTTLDRRVVQLLALIGLALVVTGALATLWMTLMIALEDHPDALSRLPILGVLVLVTVVFAAMASLCGRSLAAPADPHRRVVSEAFEAIREARIAVDLVANAPSHPDSARQIVAAVRCAAGAATRVGNLAHAVAPVPARDATELGSAATGGADELARLVAETKQTSAAGALSQPLREAMHDASDAARRAADAAAEAADAYVLLLRRR